MTHERLRIEPLGPRHDRALFGSGVEALDTYLHRYAQQDLARRLAAVFVLVYPGRPGILGYYTLSALAVDPRGLPPPLARRLPRRPLPASLLGRLAVDVNHRSQGLGRLLLLDAMQRALEASSQVASMAVVVDAKSDEARVFYEKYGFERFVDDPYRLFIPMATIAALVAG